MSRSFDSWVVIVFWVGTLTILVRAGAAGETIAVSGASKEEAAQVAMVFYHVAEADLRGRQAAIDKVVKEFPQNRPARQLHAEIAISAGDIKTADADIRWMTSNSPDFSDGFGWSAQAELAEATGDRRRETDGYRHLLAFESEAPRVEARLAELSGDAARARQLWAKLRDESPGVPGLGLLDYANFQVRQGDFAGAAESAEAALKALPKHDPMWGAVTNAARTKLAELEWALGHRARALKLASEALRAQLDSLENTDTFRKLDDLEPYVLCSTLIKRDEPAEAESRRTAERAMQQLTRRLPDGNGIGMMLVVNVMQGKVAASAGAKTLRGILADAPYLSEALWPALYLALLYPSDCGELAKLLPEKSLQRRIFEAENAGKGSLPRK